MPCPFQSKHGFSTKEAREEFISWRSKEKNADVKEIPETLEANPNTSEPLYFWQLYSILGKEPIQEFITVFYDRIFDDEEDWFRLAFSEVCDKHMHIKSQSSYWIDSFGGGRVYWGGHSRLGFHHSSNHAEPVMDIRGAARWLYHMKHAIRSYDFTAFEDPRILPCIVEFLRVKVFMYAEEFRWEFDDTDFDVIDYDYAHRHRVIPVPSTKLLPRYVNHNGYRMPSGFPVQGFHSALTYEAMEQDLFVASYPKSGTTWMQHIVWLLLNGGEPLAPDQRLDQVFPHLEEVGAEKCQRQELVGDQYHLIKTHLYHEMTPHHPKAKYIHVVRNPKDVVVSFFHHTRGFEQLYHFGTGSFDDYFDLFLKGEVDFGDYFRHLRAWMDHRNDPNVMLITYEAMKRDLRAAILQVASFLEDNALLAALTNEEDSFFARMLEYSSLGHMQQDLDRWSSKRPDKHPPFVRKGKVGGWGELLTPTQASQLDQKMKEVFTMEELEGLGAEYCST